MQWDKAKKKPNILPRLEAVHIGPLLLRNIRRAIFIRDRDGKAFHEFEIVRFDRPRFKALLPEWREDFTFARLPIHEQMKLRQLKYRNVPNNPDLAKRMAEGQKRVDKIKRQE